MTKRTTVALTIELDDSENLSYKNVEAAIDMLIESNYHVFTKAFNAQGLVIYQIDSHHDLLPENDCAYCDKRGRKRACGRVLCDDCYSDHLVNEPEVGIYGCRTCAAEEFFEAGEMPRGRMI